MQIKKYREINRDCSPLERPSKVRPNKEDPSSEHLDEEPKTTKEAKNIRNHPDMDMTYIQEKRERLQNILKQEKGTDWVSWIDEGQDYLKNGAHDSYSNNDVDSALTKTQECEE